MNQILYTVRTTKGSCFSEVPVEYMYGLVLQLFCVFYIVCDKFDRICATCEAYLFYVLEEIVKQQLVTQMPVTITAETHIVFGFFKFLPFISLSPSQ